MSESADASATSAFPSSRAWMERLVGFLNSEEAAGLPLAALEARLEAEHQELVNALMQDHAELRAEHDRTTGVRPAPQHASPGAEPAARPKGSCR